MIRPSRAKWAALALALALCACAPGPTGPESGEAGADPEWAIAIHGGAGVIAPEELGDLRDAYLDSLRSALDLGRTILDRDGSALDAVERVIMTLEDDPGFNAGKGAVYNHDGEHELDASIMDGRTLACGAVAGVRTVKNPIVLARRVMETSPHVLFAGDGAERFADESAVERVDPAYFHTERRRDAWLRYRQAEDSRDAERGTVGVVALDRRGDLAAGTSTGGLTGKRYGRVGDTPLIGAGTYADNGTCAVSCTGKGEEFIRHHVASRISMLVGSGRTLDEAVREVVERRLRDGDGGVIAVDRHGRIVMAFNTGGMFRGAADSSGRFEVAIWD